MRFFSLAVFFLIVFSTTTIIKAGIIDSLSTGYDSTIASDQDIENLLEQADKATDVTIALIHASRALSDAEKLGSENHIAESKLAISKCYEIFGRYQEALGHLEDALSIYSELDDEYNRILTIKSIGNIYYYSREFDQSMDYYDEIYEYGKIHLDTALMLDGMIGRGSVFGNTSKMDSALAIFTEVNSLAKLFKDTINDLRSYFYMGDVNLFSNQPRKALAIFHDFENNYNLEEIAPRYIAINYNSIARAYIAINDLRSAKLYNDKTLQAIKKYPRYNEFRSYYLTRYRIDTLSENYEAALKHYTKYRQLDDSIKNSNFKNKLADFETLYDLQRKESQIEQLTLENQLKDIKISNRNTQIYSSVAIILLLFVILFLVIRTVISTKVKNKLLQEQKDILSDANELITAQSEDLKNKKSELENLLEELSATQQHLAQNEKMASIGTLTSGVAHEINNPLNFIHGGLNLIRKINEDLKTLNCDEVKTRIDEALEIITNGYERVNSIVKALDTFSRNIKTDSVTFDIHQIIDNTLLFLNSKIADDISIIKEYNLKRNVAIYPEKMQQVIMNILDNAVFATKNPELEKRQIKISTSQQKESFILRFYNTGPPIDKKHLKQLFDPFFTTKDPGEGTGLGLAICHTIVREHNGTLDVKNEDQGVSFVIEIPLTS